VPPEVEWFANISNAHSRRAYQNAINDFVRFTGINRPEEFRTVTRAHIIAWREELASRSLGGSTIRCRWRPESASIRRRLRAGSLLPALALGGQRDLNRAADAELKLPFRWSATG
jgi:hypothetical protein